MEVFYPTYSQLCAEHSKAIANKNITNILEAEKQINDFKQMFFNI